MGISYNSYAAFEALGDDNSDLISTNEKRFVIMAAPKSDTSFRRLFGGVVFSLVALGALGFRLTPFIITQGVDQANSAASSHIRFGHTNEEQCLQAESLAPRYTNDALADMDRYLLSEAYSNCSADLLSEAITFQTVSYENMIDPD